MGVAGIQWGNQHVFQHDEFECDNAPHASSLFLLRANAPNLVLYLHPSLKLKPLFICHVMFMMRYIHHSRAQYSVYKGTTKAWLLFRRLEGMDGLFFTTALLGQVFHSYLCFFFFFFFFLLSDFLFSVFSRLAVLYDVAGVSSLVSFLLFSFFPFLFPFFSF